MLFAGQAAGASRFGEELMRCLVIPSRLDAFVASEEESRLLALHVVAERHRDLRFVALKLGDVLVSIGEQHDRQFLACSQTIVASPESLG